MTEENLVYESSIRDAETKTDIGDFAFSSACYFLKCENFEKAKTFLKITLEMDPTNPDALAMLAWAEFQSKRKNLALQTLESKKLLNQVLARDDQNARAYLYLRKIMELEEKEF